MKSGMIKGSSSFQRITPTLILRALLSFVLLRACWTRNTLFDLDLSTQTLNPKATGFMITGNTGTPQLGYSVSTAGDVNNDGYDDIIIGAWAENSNHGAVYVIYGGEESTMSNWDFSSGATLNPLTTGFMITGNAAEDCLGWTASTAGDIDNDGYDDIIVGAYKKNSYQGAVYVIYGGAKSTMSDIDLSTQTLDPLTTGFTITGNAANDYFGISVSTAGDINKDGYDDIIIGAYVKNVIYVIYGGAKSTMSDITLSSKTLIPASTGFVITGNIATDGFGISVDTAGDVNNDGYDDIIVGAYGRNSLQGAAYVIYGGQKSSMSSFTVSSTTLIPTSTGFTITGNAANDFLGWSVSAAGDINKDEYNDIIIGAPYNNNKGAAYVIYGGANSKMSNFDFSTQTLDPLTTGFMITGNAANENFGISVSTAGDINNDGYDDIIIGAYFMSSVHGGAYVIYGGAKSSISNIALSTTTLNPVSTGLMITGNAVNDILGRSVSAAGDVNNDGYDDIIIGADAKNSLQGAAYVIYASCSRNCIQCSSESVCTECKNLYLMYDYECFDSCPTGTYTSTDTTCNGTQSIRQTISNYIDCLSYCSSCTSQDSCQSCSQGFTLSSSNSLCVFSSQDAHEKAYQAISSATQGIGSVLCVASSAFPLSALVSKIVQSTRYLNISVTNDLAEVYQTWQTDLISWDVPNVMSNLDHFDTSPSLFAQYDLGSPFLVNFWPTLLNIGIGFGTFIACILLKRLCEHSKYEGWAYSLIRKFVAGSFNFALIQVYACLDDILFYLVLDAKTNPFNSFFSWASLICAVIFLGLGCLLVFYNFWTVKNYQSIKQQGTKEIEDFNERNKYWALFYSDFNDDDLWSQSFFAFCIVRSTISSFIITALYDYPLMQTSFLVILDMAILSFLYLKTPFTTLRGKLAQSYYEIITLLVHLCALILSFQDTFESPSETVRLYVSSGILYLNTAIISGTIGFMFIELYFTISEKITAARPKQYENIAVQTIDGGHFDLQSKTPSPHWETRAQRKNESWFSNEQTSSLENFRLESGGINNSNMVISDSNMESSQIQDFNQNPDASFVSVDYSRDQDPRPILYRPMPRRFKQSQHQKKTVKPNNAIHPARFVKD